MCSNYLNKYVQKITYCNIYLFGLIGYLFNASESSKSFN